ncbi:hypothetical protein CEY12_00495 [Chryseobacterium sp. T16E-39]|uniref:hypothetical protein n=1 Tax=Chryseobacterium sp. T16E-39 TaxID=2015076 RepID=UPI000B5B1EC1|nr:hypothetical protein [Chryseobacterium sp. T16E-39]ASK28679.1 hypothetical protein CEY12_00495 [Chryseobacterium sp. T16E-39]
MKHAIKLIFYGLTLFLLFQCSNYSKEFEDEFKNSVSDADQVLFEGDILHPAYAYMKNGKLKGLEFISHPECGNYTRRYFFSKNEKIKKIIVEKDYFNESCGKTFDSVYVIYPITQKVIVYTKFTKGKEIRSDIIQKEIISVERYIKESKSWKYINK